MGKHGPIVKQVKEGKTKFIGVKKHIDIDKIKSGEYTLADIIIQTPSKFQNSEIHLGIYKDDIIHVKEGKYGAYLSYKKKNYSLKTFEKTKDNITLEDAIKIIEKKYVGGSYLKIITKEASIRKGKYGPYVYYKQKGMKKPIFIKIPKNTNYEDIDMRWVQENLP